MRSVITYEEIKEKRKISGVCEKCGKPRSRTVSATQTLNPFNKNKDGTLKTASQIRSELHLEVLKKANELHGYFICATCYNNLPWPYEWPPKVKEKV